MVNVVPGSAQRLERPGISIPSDMPVPSSRGIHFNVEVVKLLGQDGSGDRRAADVTQAHGGDADGHTTIVAPQGQHMNAPSEEPPPNTRRGLRVVKRQTEITCTVMVATTSGCKEIRTG